MKRTLGGQPVEADSGRLQTLLHDVILLATPRTSTSYDGDAVTAGTVKLDLSAAPWSLPAGIRGVFVRLAAQWAASSNSSYAAVRPAGGSGMAVMVGALVADRLTDAAGLTPCDAAGDIDLVVSADAAAVWLEVWGYVR